MWLTPLKAEDTAMLAPRKAEGSAPHSTHCGGSCSSPLCGVRIRGVALAQCRARGGNDLFKTKVVRRTPRMAEDRVAVVTFFYNEAVLSRVGGPR